MAEERIYQGHVYRRNAAGEPWVIAGPAPSAAPARGGFTIGQPDPYRPRDEARKDRDQAIQEENARIAREKADRDAREWAATHNPDGSPKPKEGSDTTGTTAKIRSDAIAAYQAGEAIKQRVAEMRKLYEAGPGSTPPLAGFTDFLPTEANRAFDQAGNAVRGHVGTALGFTGGQLNSVAEANMAVGPYLPQSSDYDENAVRKMDRLLEVASESQRRAIAVLGGVPDASGKIIPLGTPATPTNSPPASFAAPGPSGGPATPPNPWETGPTGGPVAATGSTRTIRDESLNATVNALYNAGASKEQIDQVIVQAGGKPISPQVYNAVRKWMAANPGKAYNGADATRTEPLSLMNRISGSPVGAFGAHAANALTAGTVGALTGEQGEAALAAMEAMNPNAAISGTLIGGIAGAGGAEAALAARAPAALARYAPRVADALYGGLSGFNGADEGDGATGAVTGALLGTVGGAVGERVMGGVGSVARGLRDPAVDYLRASGVPLTVGQILAQGGPVGRGVKKVEDALTSVPFLGNVVEARRREGIEGFNRAAFDIGAETTGGQVQDFGSAGIRQLDQLKDQAYDDALGPVRIDATDPDLINDLGATINAAQAIPDVNGARAAALAGLQTRIDGAVDPLTDTISGRGFQEAYRGLARTGRERANSDYGHEVGQVVRQGQDALVGALQRQEPGAFEGFVNANTANRRLNVLADAVNKAKNQDDEMFFPSQLNMTDAGSARRLTGNINSAAGDRPFHELATAGQQILPSRLSDSGTASRAMVGLALGGGAGAGAGYMAGDTSTGAGLGVAATLALALGGTKGAQALASRVLLDRPDLARSIGEILQDNARIGGAVGAGSVPSIAQLLMGSP